MATPRRVEARRSLAPGMACREGLVCAFLDEELSLETRSRNFSFQYLCGKVDTLRGVARYPVSAQTVNS